MNYDSKTPSQYHLYSNMAPLSQINSKSWSQIKSKYYTLYFSLYLRITSDVFRIQKTCLNENNQFWQEKSFKYL